MPTFKPVINGHQKRADGSYNIKIRITHKRVSRWLPTNLTAYQSDLTRTLNIKNKDLEWRCNELIKEMRAAISDLSAFALEDKDVDWVVQRIKDKMAGDSFHLDFFAFAYDYVEEHKTPQTGLLYHTALRSFAKFLGEDSIDINEITHALILNYMEWVDKQPRFHGTKDGILVATKQMKLPGNGQASRNVMRLSHIYNKAKDKYNDEDAGIYAIPRNPFKSLPLSFPAPRSGQKSIGQELMQRIISAPADDPNRIALDAFLLSFLFMGANLVDMFNAKPQGNVWIYNRAKTHTRRADNAEMRVYVPEQARPILERCLTDGEWMLGTIHEITSIHTSANAYVNVELHRWQKRNGLPEFSFYSARKTWATLARKVGVEKATIDECLVHIGDMRVADIYIEKDWDIINAANEKVLALFDWPTME